MINKTAGELLLIIKKCKFPTSKNNTYEYPDF